MHRSGPVTMSVVTEHGAAVVGREEELTTIQSFVTFHPSPAQGRAWRTPDQSTNRNAAGCIA